jgi:hypothetical protein
MKNRIKIIRRVDLTLFEEKLAAADCPGINSLLRLYDE